MKRLSLGRIKIGVLSELFAQWIAKLVSPQGALGVINEWAAAVI